MARYVLESPSLRQDATNDGSERRSAHAERMRNELLTKKDAAAELSVSVRTLERLIASGQVIVTRVERSTRVRRADLDDYIARQRGSFRDRIVEKETA